jgi:molecular chaperone DnaK (HSP70)
MVQEAETNYIEDMKSMERVEFKNRLEAYLDYIRNYVRDDNEKMLGGRTVAEVKRWVEEGIKWLKENGEANKGEYDKKQKEYEELVGKTEFS